MKTIALATLVALISLTSLCQPVHATPVFVGSYAVDGNGAAPSWSTNPPVYSGQEAAALLFGGDADDYLISVDPSMDPSTVTMSAHYDGWGEPDGIFAQDFHHDTGGGGYNSAPGAGSAWSAYVFDHSDGAINYVWSNDGPDVRREGDNGDDDVPGDRAPVVPEPNGLALLSTGGLPLLGLVRRRFIG